MYRSQSPRVADNQLEVQELCVHRDQDPNLYKVDGSDIIIYIDEPVKLVKSVVMADNSVPGMVLIAASAISIVDSVALTSGGDRKAIKLASLTLAANDSLIIKYELE